MFHNERALHIIDMRRTTQSGILKEELIYPQNPN